MPLQIMTHYNVGSRRPQSFILDDEYDVITEEGESERQPREEDESSSSSESEGPDAKDAGKKIKRIPPPGALKESSGEDEDQDGEETTTSEPTLIPQPPSSLANQSFLVSDMHVEQSSVSQTVEHSSVNVYTSKWLHQIVILTIRLKKMGAPYLESPKNLNLYQ